jgi:low temperature requirement protein LtrA
MNRKTLDIFLALMGAGTLIPGLLEVLFSLTGKAYTLGKLDFTGDFTLWRGLILLSAGALYLFAINQSSPVEKRAQAVLASSMIWIVGGIEILSTVLNSITGSEGAWFSTTEGFLSHYTGPFAPSVYLLPISILLVALISSEKEKNEPEDQNIE